MRRGAPLRVAFTVDVEWDCPPFLTSRRGVEEGLPLLLELLTAEDIPATFFTTGEVAETKPEVPRTIVEAGHELAGHGMTHRDFRSLTPVEAEDEIRQSTALLRAFGPVTSFRAPYLSFPERYLTLLERAGYQLDASRAVYKPFPRPESTSSSIFRIQASTTSSALRLPRPFRYPLLRPLSDPVVLFVHPWEFVDLTREPIRLDCRFATGVPALARVREVVREFRARGARFLTMDKLRQELEAAA